MNSSRPIRRALLSVSDKTGLIEFAQFLHQQNVELISTGGTAACLRDAKLPVTDVSEITDFPEMMDGRVKTLHPKVHGGILGRRGIDDAVMDSHGISGIDLVVVNLYPFANTVASPEAKLAEAIENIDIGGPTMVRAAAKNYQDVAIVVDPEHYQTVIHEMGQQQNSLTLETRFSLAVTAFEHTAAYDGMIANYLGCLSKAAASDPNQAPERAIFPETFNQQWQKSNPCAMAKMHTKPLLFIKTSKHQKVVLPAQSSCKVKHCHLITLRIQTQRLNA